MARSPAPRSRWGAVVTVRTEVLEDGGSEITGPHFEGADQLKAIAPGKFYATVGFPLKASGEVPPYHAYLDGQRIGGLENLSEDLTLAARYALLDMIDYIEREHGLTREQAYVLSSVAVDLVDRPGGGRAELHRLRDPRSRGIRIAVAARRSPRQEMFTVTGCCHKPNPSPQPGDRDG